MKKMLRVLFAALLLAVPAAAWAQSSPGLVYGQVPTAAQWNSYFAAKQDYSTVLANIVNGTTPVTPFTATVGGTVNPPTTITGKCLSDGNSWVSCGGSPPVGANPTATIGAAAVNGVAATFMRSDAAPALPSTLPAINGSLLTGLTVSQVSGAAPLASPIFTGTVTIPNGGVFGTPASLGLANATGLVPSTGLNATGTASSSTYLRGDNSWQSVPAGVVGANPTATIGATAVNGSAGTFMRSDAAPALPATLPALNGSLLTSMTISQISGGAPLASPTFTGTVTIPTGGIFNTPASINLTNGTALPIAGLSGLGTGVGAALAAAVTGSGGIVLATGPVIDLTNVTSGTLPISGINATGTPSSTTFLAGNGQWSVPPGTGNVAGPGSAVVGNLASYGNTSGTLLQDTGIAGSNVVVLTGSQTLLGKIMSGASNTFSLIPSTAFSTNINAQTGTSYAIASTDGGQIITANNASAQNYSIVAATNTGYQSGFETTVTPIGAGAVTVTATTSTFGNGLTTLACNPGQACDFASNGTNYPFTSMSLPLVPQNGILAQTGASANYPVPTTSANITKLLSANALAQLNQTQNYSALQSNAVTTLSLSGANITPDGSNNNYAVTLVHASCPCTLVNPSVTPVAGTSGVLEVIQSATGSDIINTFGSSWIFQGGTSTIAFSPGASAIDVFSYYVLDATHILLSVGAANPTH